ncbi:MAG: CdaR family protein [Tepidisphaerales bacterium]
MAEEKKSKFAFLNYMPRAPHYVHGVHDHPSVPSRVFQGIKTFLFVAPLTFLIWVYAEREQMVPLNGFGVTIDVRTNQPDRLVTIIVPEDRRLILDLEGPRASIDAVQDQLSDRSKPVVLTLPEDVKPGFEGEINAADQIARNDAFARNAVSVLRVRPPLRVKVEAKMSRKVAIEQAKHTAIVGDVVFEPSTATIEGPASVVNAIPDDKLVLYADMSKFATLPRGKYEDTVPLSFPLAIERITFPRNVKVKVDMRESLTVTLQTIPVKILSPAAVVEKDRYKVSGFQVTLPNVNVNGPPDAIELLKLQKFPAAAILELTAEEATTPGEKTKRLTAADYRMPKDVTVTNPEREITFTVSDRGP